MIDTLIAPTLSLFLTAFNNARLEWPEESAIGVNAGIAPGKSGFSLFYAKGPNQINLGVFYSVGGEIAERTAVSAGLSYNLSLTDWGLYFATGLNAIYDVESGPYDEEDIRQPWEPEVGERGTAWRSRGIRSPEVTVGLGEQVWFGEKGRFGIHADAGLALPFGYESNHAPYPVAGAGVSWRLRFD